MNKIIKIIILIIVVLLVIWGIIVFIDYYRCSHLKEPIFIYNKLNVDVAFSSGRKDFDCFGLGYRIRMSTIPTLEDNIQITSIKMYLFNNICIVKINSKT